MRSSWRLAALLASLTLPFQAHAAPQGVSSPLFGQFKQHCIDIAAKPRAVADAARGWNRVDQPSAEALAAAGGPFERADAWSYRAGDGRTYTLVSGVQRDGPGERRTCTLSGPADADAGAAARAWLGDDIQPAFSHGEDMASYRLVNARGRPRPVTPAATRDPESLTQLSGLAVATKAGTTTLSFATFAPDPRHEVVSPNIELDRTVWKLAGQ